MNLNSLSAYQLSLTKQLLEHPYQQYCGIEILEQRAGFCRTPLYVSEQIDNLSHTLHGGVIYSMCDVTSMFATIATLKDDEYALTTSFASQMLAATPRQTWVEFEATVSRNGKNMLFSEVKAYKMNCDSRCLIATAQLTKLKRKLEIAA